MIMRANGLSAHRSPKHCTGLAAAPRQRMVHVRVAGGSSNGASSNGSNSSTGVQKTAQVAQPLLKMVQPGPITGTATTVQAGVAVAEKLGQMVNQPNLQLTAVDLKAMAEKLAVQDSYTDQLVALIESVETAKAYQGELEAATNEVLAEAQAVTNCIQALPNLTPLDNLASKVATNKTRLAAALSKLRSAA